MNCVKCRETELVKLRAAVGVPAWSCQRCGGVWVADGKVLGAVPPTELTADGGAGGGFDHQTGLCPEGHGLLTRAQTHVGAGFFLEKCDTCWGVWFDQGEWQEVAAAGLSSGLFEIWSPEWQKERRHDEAQASYRAQLLTELGEDLVSRIEGVAGDLAHHPSRALGTAYLLACLRGEPR